MLSNNLDGLAHAQVSPHEGSKGFAAVMTSFLLQFPAPGSNLLAHEQNNLSAETSVLRALSHTKETGRTEPSCALRTGMK